jgi:hypothetical protein
VGRRFPGVALVVGCGVLLFAALAVAACDGNSPNLTTSLPTTLPLSTTSVASSATTSVPTSPEGLVILLTENSSQAGYYVDGWQGYNEPLFALWPDFRMMVRVAGGYKGEPPVYEEAMLTLPEVAQLRTWAAAADLSTLKDTYTLAGGFSDPLVWRLEVGNTQSAKAVTFERYPFPTDEPGYPARLKTFVDQLMNYRPPELKPFIPDRINVLVVERAPIKGKTSTLPPEFDPNNMEVASRSVEEVQYQAVFSGEEAAKIRALLDAGQFFYNTERRSYYVYYLPLIELPQPSPPTDWLGTTSTATLPASEPSFHRELSGTGYYTVMVHTVPEGDAKVMEVLVWVDPGKETRATYDIIYDQAIALAKKYGIADSTGGRLRVVLFDAAPGQFIGESIIESRDFSIS